MHVCEIKMQDALLTLFLIDISTEVYVLGYRPGTQQSLGRWISQHQTPHPEESSPFIPGQKYSNDIYKRGT